MIFIKGTPNAPQCGFSRTLVDLLKTSNVTYASFDVLSDDAVRQGLKTFSNWPTVRVILFSQFFIELLMSAGTIG